MVVIMEIMMLMKLFVNDSSDNTNDTIYIVLLTVDMIITMMVLVDGSVNGNR